MEDNITEKFALLNLIKALQGISAPPPAASAEAATEAAPAPAPENVTEQFNAMASILERHEAISNRVKNRK